MQCNAMQCKSWGLVCLVGGGGPLEVLTLCEAPMPLLLGSQQHTHRPAHRHVVMTHAMQEKYLNLPEVRKKLGVGDRT